MNKKLISTVLGGLGILGISSQALAYEVFTVNPNSIPGTSGFSTFQADSLSGVSSGQILLDASTQTATESGYVSFTAFNLGGSAVSNFTSGLATAPAPDQYYGLYLDFTLTASLVTGSFGAANSTYNLDTLTFTLYADPDLNTTFTQASLINAASIGGNISDDIVLATGSLIIGQSNIILGGVALNSTTDFQTTAEGNAFFTSPIPFYEHMFDAFNNTGDAVIFGYDAATGCLTGECIVAVKSGVGTFDFKGVPEPATLALLGIGLLGFGTSRLRKKA